MDTGAGKLASEIISQIYRVEHVGGAISLYLLNWLNYQPTLTHFAEGNLKRLKNNPTLKLWILFSSVSLLWIEN